MSHQDIFAMSSEERENVYQDLAQRFVELLQLKQAPIGLAFLNTIPPGVAQTSRRVPSACTFWRLAEQGVFYASAEDHQECPLGMLIMGFLIPEAVQQRSREMMQTMADVRYLSPAEVNALPVIDKPHQCIVYGRLDQFPGEAEVVLCILSTQQAMLVAEAQGNTDWLKLSAQAAFGRPTCAIIPRVLHSGSTIVSLGCVGTRTFIGLTPGEIVLTLPASEFVGLVERLEVTVAANNELASFHQRQKEKYIPF